MQCFVLKTYLSKETSGSLTKKRLFRAYIVACFFKASMSTSHEKFAFTANLAASADIIWDPFSM
jgi:hypothetical protein